MHGKNIINVMHAVGSVFKELSPLQVASMVDHPHGPGALKYYAMTPNLHREKLMRQVSAMLPSRIYISNNEILDHRLLDFGHETTQYTACATWRAAQHHVSGAIPQHMIRNSAIAKL